MTQTALPLWARAFVSVPGKPNIYREAEGEERIAMWRRAAVRLRAYGGARCEDRAARLEALAGDPVGGA